MTEVAEKPAEVVADTTGDASKEDEAAKPAVKLECEALRDALAKQIDYYFSRTNLSNDAYLVSQMDAQMFVPIATICNFKLMKMLTEDQSVILDVMKQSKNVVLNDETTHVRPNFTNQRNTIIMREIPSATPVDEVKALFASKAELVQPSTVRSDIGDHWFIQFDQEDDCLAAFMWLKSQKFNDKPIQARIKSENILRGLYTSPAEGGMPDGGAGYGFRGGAPRFGGGYGLIPVPQGDKRRFQQGGAQRTARPAGTGRAGAPAQGNGDAAGAGANGARPAAKKTKGAKKTRDGVKAVSSAEGAVVLNHPSFQLGMTSFPPLPTKPGDKRPAPKQSGYQKEFKKYTREEMVELVKKLSSESNNLNRPDGMASDCPVVLAKPDTGLEIDKPLPPPIPMYVALECSRTVWNA